MGVHRIITSLQIHRHHHIQKVLPRAQHARLVARLHVDLHLLRWHHLQRVEQVERIEADLHNLTPAVGELNGDRSNTPYGIVEGEPRLYGECNFEIGGKPRVTEPREEVRGDAARIWLYMADTYKIKLSDTQRKMFEEWSAADPVDDWERLRDTRIWAAQGNRNPFVK